MVVVAKAQPTILGTLFSDVIPPLSPEEYAALKADIEQNGLVKSILVDENNNILDGHHRYRACSELGMEVRTERCDGVGDEQDKRLRIITLNFIQRQMSKEDRQRLSDEQKRYAKKMLIDGRGLREIARLVGRSLSTIQGWRDSMGDRTGQSEQSTENTNESLTAIADNSKKTSMIQQSNLAEQKAKVLALAASGARQSDIASAVGLHPQTVKKWTDDPKSQPVNRGKDSGQPRKLRDSDVERLFNAGKSQPEIANELGVARHTVGTYLKRLGLSRSGKRAKNPLTDHVSRADAEAGAWAAGAETIVATAKVSSPEQVRDLISALGRLSRAASNLKGRLNKEVEQKE